MTVTKKTGNEATLLKLPITSCSNFSHLIIVCSVEGFVVCSTTELNSFTHSGMPDGGRTMLITSLIKLNFMTLSLGVV